MTPSLAGLPALPLADWEPSRLQLHLMTQIVGKIRLALHPWRNHWWHSTLYLSARGLTTGPIPFGAESFDAELDLVDHALVVRTTKGEVAKTPLDGRPICDFYRDVHALLAGLGVEVAIDARPYKCKSSVPFDGDREHATYDPAAVSRAWRVLSAIAPVFDEFRGRFTGKSSPVHFFWHSFDLAVTRFSGRRAPELPGADRVTREAYSHEVSSAGFWFGDDTTPEPTFYSYAAPAPDGLVGTPLSPPTARWLELHGSPMAILRYEDVRTSARPEETLLAFLQSSYEGAADLARWDRAALER
ncbi:DUF5996 family protein [Myxococcota bacterium]|nr:DUF5996 family protein [Myxococcota bacterium]